MPQIKVITNAYEVAAKLRKAGTDIPNDVLKPVVDGLADEGMHLYRRTVNLWRHKPFFEKRRTSSSGMFRADIGTDDDIYRWVDWGTPRHPIAARNAPFLVFHRVFESKTVPGSLRNRPGYEGGHLVRIKRLPRGHPGIRARKFTEYITRVIFRAAPHRIATALANWARKL